MLFFKKKTKEAYEIAFDSAQKHYKVADHIFSMTFPLSNDPKLLKLVQKNIFLCLKGTLKGLYEYESLNKRTQGCQDDFKSMIKDALPLFERYNLSKGYVDFLLEIEEINQKQKSSSVEFIRKEKFVFASSDFDLTYISAKEVKASLAKAKLFMQEVLGVVKENERINGKR
jgi:hypothetical protein